MREKATNFVDRVMLVLLGAFLILVYLEVSLDPVPSLVEKLQLYVLAGWALCGLLSAVLQWGQPRKYAVPVEPSPPAIAATVVLSTGLAAAYYFALSESRDFMLAAGIAMITLTVAWPVYRFAKRHEAEIGEARFDTSGDARDRSN